MGSVLYIMSKFCSFNGLLEVLLFHHIVVTSSVGAVPAPTFLVYMLKGPTFLNLLWFSPTKID